MIDRPYCSTGVIKFICKDRFIQIFLEEGNDEEWAEICWDRAVRSNRLSDSETEIRNCAKGWKQYSDSGGF